MKKALVGCHHSSVDLSAPTILPPWVQVPCTSTLLSLIVFVLYLSCEKMKINKKRPGMAHFFKKSTSVYFELGKFTCKTYLESKTRFSADIFLKNGPTPGSFSFIFGHFKQTSIQFLQQINVKKCPSSI